MNDHPATPDSKIVGKGYITLAPPLVPSHPKWLLFIFWCSTMLCVVMGWTYYMIIQQVPWMLLLLPLEILAFVYVFMLSSLFFVMVAIKVLERKHPPVEGVFPHDSPEIRRYQARLFFKHYAIWLTRHSMFPWIDKIAYSALGVRVGKTVVLHEAWVDPELVEIGDYCMVGMNSIVLSHVMDHDIMLVKKTVLDSHAVIGAFGLLAPGVKVGKLCVLGANSGTRIDQVLEEKYLYAGDPARKLKKIE